MTDVPLPDNPKPGFVSLWQDLREKKPGALPAILKRAMFVFGIAAPVIVILVPALVSLAGELRNGDTPVLNEIAMPASLAVDGHSSGIFTRRIGDSYYKIRTEAAVAMRSQDLAVGQSSIAVERPRLVVTDPNQSLASIFVYAMSFLHPLKHSEISGEIIKQGTHLLLTLRLNGHPIGDTPIAADTLDGLTHPAAEAIMRNLQPAMLATWYYRRENYEEAANQARNIILWRSPGDPNLVTAHNLLGLIYRNAKNFPAAIDEFHTVEKLDAYSPQPHINLANIFYKQAQKDRARVYAALWEAHRAVQLNPRSAAAHITLGNIYLFQTRFRDAIREYRIAIAHDRTNAAAHSNLGWAYAQKKEPVDIAGEYRLAIAYAPKDLYPRENLARLYWNQKNLVAAIREYRAVREIGPKEFPFYIHFASVLAEQSRISRPADAKALLAEACQALIQGARKFPDDTDFNNQARALITRGKLDCALPGGA